jgi:recombination protein RecR
MKRPAAVKELIEELKRLPGIGQKTAERLSFYLMRGEKERVENLARTIMNIKEKVILCSNCHGITEVEYVMENMGDYRGEYHVLMGVISPLDGIGPQDLTTEDLKTKVGKNGVREVILATNPDMEGESTAVYIARMLKGADVKVTRIARGLPVGGDIEYADPVTLKKSMEGRMEIDT